ncbi:hypothetical protein B566_EDAN004661 [Ephemera danica]|nr:hypothetical protein B566_EDAN004661 [Ephemera danica]
MTELKNLVPRLTSEAVTAICRPSELAASGRDVPPGALSFAQIEHLLRDSGNIDSENTVANMRVLARHNPHWGIAVLENGFIVTDPALPTMCYVRTTILALLYFLFICVPVLGAVTAIGWIAYTQYSQRYPSPQQVSAMVSRIQDTLNSYNKAGQNCASVSMIRDELVPAKDRKREFFCLVIPFPF